LPGGSHARTTGGARAKGTSPGGRESVRGIVVHKAGCAVVDGFAAARPANQSA